jgi:hypothetical protein
MKISRQAVMLCNLGLFGPRDHRFCRARRLASRETVLSAAVDAYIYGYQLAIMDMTRRQLTNVATAGRHVHRLADCSDCEATRRSMTIPFPLSAIRAR